MNAERKGDVTTGRRNVATKSEGRDQAYKSSGTGYTPSGTWKASSYSLSASRNSFSRYRLSQPVQIERYGKGYQGPRDAEARQRLTLL
eukprot:1926099-Rhodomonas_salina.1